MRLALRLGYIRRVFHLSLCLITFGGHSAHLPGLVHKSGRKTATFTFVIVYKHFEWLFLDLFLEQFTNTISCMRLLHINTCKWENYINGYQTIVLFTLQLIRWKQNNTDMIQRNILGALKTCTEVLYSNITALCMFWTNGIQHCTKGLILIPPPP